MSEVKQEGGFYTFHCPKCDTDVFLSASDPNVDKIKERCLCNVITEDTEPPLKLGVFIEQGPLPISKPLTGNTIDEREKEAKKRRRKNKTDWKEES